MGILRSSKSDPNKAQPAIAAICIVLVVFMFLPGCIGQEERYTPPATTTFVTTECRPVDPQPTNHSLEGLTYIIAYSEFLDKGCRIDYNIRIYGGYLDLYITTDDEYRKTSNIADMKTYDHHRISGSYGNFYNVPHQDYWAVLIYNPYTPTVRVRFSFQVCCRVVLTSPSSR